MSDPPKNVLILAAAEFDAREYARNRLNLVPSGAGYISRPGARHPIRGDFCDDPRRLDGLSPDVWECLELKSARFHRKYERILIAAQKRGITIRPAP